MKYVSIKNEHTKPIFLKSRNIKSEVCSSKNRTLKLLYEHLPNSVTTVIHVEILYDNIFNNLSNKIENIDIKETDKFNDFFEYNHIYKKFTKIKFPYKIQNFICSNLMKNIKIIKTEKNVNY